MHIGYDRLQADMAGVLKDADAVGAKTIVNPYLPHKAKPFASRDEILKAASDFATWSKACRAAGKRFAYHIHGQEFGQAPEGTLFDVLAKESGPDVGFEADVYWVAYGGADPVALMKQVPGPGLVHAHEGHGQGRRTGLRGGSPRGVERRPRHGPDRHQGDPGRRRRRPASR